MNYSDEEFFSASDDEQDENVFLSHEAADVTDLCDEATTITDEQEIYKLFNEIVPLLQPDNWLLFGRTLGLLDVELKGLESYCEIRNLGFQEKYFQMLLKWKQKFPEKINRNYLLDILKQVTNATYRKHDDRHIRTCLEERYKSYRPPYFFWMNDMRLSLKDFYVELSVVQSRDIVENSKLQIHLDEIFQNSINCKRYLIKGDTESGKSTLVLKLAYDWALHKWYMNSFELVFVIQLRYLKKSIQEYLLENFLGTNHICSATGENVLFLLDGHDELPTESKDSVRELLNGEIFPNATVLVTSTNDIEKTCSGFIPEYSRINSNVFEKILTIRSMSEDYKRYLIKKQIFEDMEGHDIEIEDIMSKIPSQFSKHPIPLLLLALLIRSEKLNLMNQTEVFVHILNFLLKCWVKEKIDVNSDINILNLANDENDMKLRTSLKEVGKFCFKCLDDEKRIITEEDINKISSITAKDLMSTGFFYECQSDSVSSSRLFKPIHSLLIGFLGAYYLFSLRKEEELFETLRDFKNINALSLDFDGMFLQFLFDLFGDEINVLLKGLQPFAFLYSSRIMSFLELFNATKLSDNKLDYIAPYISEGVSLDRQIYDNILGNNSNSRNLKLEVVSHFVEAKKIQHVIWYSECPIPINEGNIQLKTIRICIGNYVLKSNLEISRRIQCEELIFMLEYVKDTCLDELWKDLMTVIQNVKFMWLSLYIKHINDKISMLLTEETKRGTFKDVIMKSIYYEGTLNSKKPFQTFLKLVQHKPIFNIAVRIVLKDTVANSPVKKHKETLNQNDIDTFINNLVKNPNVQALSFHNMYSKQVFVVNLNTLTDNNRKLYSSVILEGVDIKQKTTNVKPIPIDTFGIHGYSMDTDEITKILKGFSPRVIQCHHEVIQKLMMEEGYFALCEELQLTLSGSFIFQHYFQCLKKFNRLQVLSLVLTSMSNDSYDESTAEFVSVLRCLQLNKLELIDSQRNLDFIFAFIVQLSKHADATSEDKQRTIILPELKIHFNRHDYVASSKFRLASSALFSILEKIRTLLQNDELRKFHLTCNVLPTSGKEFSVHLVKIFPIKDGFIIQRSNEVDESKTLDDNDICTYSYDYFSVSFCKAM